MYRNWRWKLLILGMAYLSVSQSAGTAEGAVKPTRGLLQPGTPAPAFSLKDLRGETVTLSELTGQKTVLLHFFFLDSGFCRAELPYLQQAYEQFQAKGLEVLCINVGARDTPEEIERFWKANRLTLRILKNGSGRDDVSEVYGVRTYPAHFLVGRDGKVISAWLGFPKKTGAAQLSQRLAAAGLK